MSGEIVGQRQITWFDEGDTPPSKKQRRVWCDPENPANPFSKCVGNEEAVRQLSRAAFAALRRYNRCCRDYCFALLGRSSTTTLLAKMFAELICLPFVHINARMMGTSLNDIFVRIAEECKQTVVGDGHTLELLDLGDRNYKLPPMIVFIDVVHLLPSLVVAELVKALNGKTSRLVTEQRAVVDCSEVCWLLGTDHDAALVPFGTRFARLVLDGHETSESSDRNTSKASSDTTVHTKGVTDLIGAGMDHRTLKQWKDDVVQRAAHASKAMEDARSLVEKILPEIQDPSSARPEALRSVIGGLQAASTDAEQAINKLQTMLNALANGKSGQSRAEKARLRDLVIELVTGLTRQKERTLQVIETFHSLLANCQSSSAVTDDPQQAAPADCAAAIRPAQCLKEAMEELNSLIGLGGVKAQVKDYASFLNTQQARKKHGIKEAVQTLHFIFKGNPGTGKTTVARIIGKILYGLGFLKTAKVVECDGGGLISKFLGATTEKTAAVIDSALDGVLFIDEAYGLTQDSDNQAGSYGRQAIETLLKRMVDNRDRLVVIAAGYPSLMDSFVRSNPGLESRFSRFIHFDDYTVSDMCAIFEVFCKKQDYLLEDRASEVLRRLFSAAYAEKKEGFGNGRFVERVFERATVNHGIRIDSFRKSDASRAMLMTLIAQDIPLDEAGTVLSAPCPNCKALCPYLAGESTVACFECGLILRLDPAGSPSGVTIECPACETHFMGEAQTLAECPKCSLAFRVDATGEYIGGESVGLVCPACGEDVFVCREQVAQREFACPECGANKGKWTILKDTCPCCGASAERASSTDCFWCECGSMFSLDENCNVRCIEVTCPACSCEWCVAAPGETTCPNEWDVCQCVFEADRNGAVINVISAIAHCIACHERFVRSRSEVDQGEVMCYHCNTTYGVDRDGNALCPRRGCIGVLSDELRCNECGESWSIWKDEGVLFRGKAPNYAADDCDSGDAESSLDEVESDVADGNHQNDAALGEHRSTDESGTNSLGVTRRDAARASPSSEWDDATYLLRVAQLPEWRRVELVFDTGDRVIDCEQQKIAKIAYALGLPVHYTQGAGQAGNQSRDTVPRWWRRFLETLMECSPAEREWIVDFSRPADENIPLLGLATLPESELTKDWFRNAIRAMLGAILMQRRVDP